VRGLRREGVVGVHGSLRVTAGNGCHGGRAAAPRAGGGRVMLGKRLLIVEDEFVIALDLQHLLEAAGHQVVGLAANVEDALALIEAAPIDGAVLDINLRGDRVTAVADMLARRGVPFLFVSGYGQAGRPAGHERVPVLAKPYNEHELLAQVERF
jgi:CheY-like chemotaxis protein